ncbi:dephospho-CoA kinase [Desulfotomaculum copahuensis]|uniref:Dephospho-CoA kinase n=1 Tax=Desulfotomaculum copahuensis TaxID=1838280 RepID=A0A1B7LE25_9FIRM|nr:dephospho-CoA kinase [Desulfotomaculum copahuensis]OAT81305.1 dephospho-CoA kinase [Desulfotomaculum copahuensis]
MIVGLTGGIATGKSTVSALFRKLGAHIIDFDELAHMVIEPGRPAWREIIRQFGPAVLNPDQTVDRQKLGRIVFNHPDRLTGLNRIVHPAVFAADREITAGILEKEPRALIIKDVPLLTETAAREMVEKVIVVYASPEVQMQRMLGRGFNREEAQKRIDAQDPLSEKLKFADYVVYNDGSLEETERQVKEIYGRLQADAGRKA